MRDVGVICCCHGVYHTRQEKSRYEERGQTPRSGVIRRTSLIDESTAEAVRTEWVEFESNGVTVSAYLALPEQHQDAQREGADDSAGAKQQRVRYRADEQ